MTDEEQFRMKLENVTDRLHDIMLTKRRMRGRDNIVEQGIGGVVERMYSDKLARIRRDTELRHAIQIMKKHGLHPGPIPEVSEESFVDDLIDVANYAIICIMLEEGTW